MKKQVFLLIIGCLHLLLISGCSEDKDIYISRLDISERLYAGGETTVFTQTSNAFSFPAPNLDAASLERHLSGDLQFEQIFVTAPAQVNPGLGPIFNNSACILCHPKDGRSPFPNNINARSGLLVRISGNGQDIHGGPVPITGYGLQVQNQAIFGYVPEAAYTVNFIEKTETLADGTVVHLRKPVITIDNLYIPINETYYLSPRLATPVFGLGLLEYIPEADIIASQDVNDSNGDGIYGKANFVYDPVSESIKLGRFGWKANNATLLNQNAGAYVEDMGVTNYVFPMETGYNQMNGNDGLDDDPEITPIILDDVTFYTATLGVPAPRNIDNAEVQRGAAIFEEIQCTVCHKPQQRTGYSPIDALSYQTFYPYTDMLLHDMGEEMADGRQDFLASGREWKTRPLWGIGLTQLVNGHTNFLHDGRARNLTEAILWHGGEAESSKIKFKNLSTQDREALLKFLNSL